MPFTAGADGTVPYVSDVYICTPETRHKLYRCFGSNCDRFGFIRRFRLVWGQCRMTDSQSLKFQPKFLHTQVTRQRLACRGSTQHGGHEFKTLVNSIQCTVQYLTLLPVTLTRVANIHYTYSRANFLEFLKKKVANSNI